VEGFAPTVRARLSSKNRRVLLLDEGWTQTIELARSLEREGFAVTVATANGTNVRTTHRSVEWISSPRVESPALVGWIDERMTAFDLVLPQSERLMARLWDACVPWSDRVWPSTDAWQRRVVRDKIALVEELAARGVPTLRQRRIDLDDARGIERVARDLHYPLVAKGAIGVGGERVRIVDHARELDGAMRWARELGGAWCLQEWASGPTYLVGGVFDEGRALRLYAGEKLEQWPARVGPAIRMRSTCDARVREVGAAAIQELWWTGLASADVIRRADGSVALLEINPRPWGSIGCAASAGVDLWSAFAALVRGDDVDADLSCGDGDERAVFPRYLMAPWYQSVRGAKMALRDLVRESDWRHPRFLVHTLRRLARLSRSARV
jgi:hypothetical protein